VFFTPESERQKSGSGINISSDIFKSSVTIFKVMLWLRIRNGKILIGSATLKKDTSNNRDASNSKTSGLRKLVGEPIIKPYAQKG
jgi:hypothetical protein